MHGMHYTCGDLPQGEGATSSVVPVDGYCVTHVGSNVSVS